MTVYVWLKNTCKMISYSSMEEYHESYAYSFQMEGIKIQCVMVETNTPLWKKL